MAIALKINSFASKNLLSKHNLFQFHRLNSNLTVKSITKKISVIKQKESKHEQQAPLCVLLGWGNSKQKHIRKYSEIYEDRGFNTITVSPLLIDALIFPQTKGKKISYKILETITNEFEGNHVPVVFHQFSDGGCALYYFMCAELLKEDSVYRQKINVVGTVFDSCPVVPDFDSISIAQRAFTNQLKNPVLKWSVWYSLRFILPFVVWLNPIAKVFMESMKNFPISSPQLFLYSKSDMLAPYEDIDDFIEFRKRNGVQTMAKLWKNSPHVGHLMTDREGYIGMIDKFIKKLSF